MKNHITKRMVAAALAILIITTSPFVGVAYAQIAENNDNQTVVDTYEKLTTAIQNQESQILISSKIYVEETIKVTYDCTIKGEQDSGLVRAAGFTDGAILMVGDDTWGWDGAPVELTIVDLLIDGNMVDAEEAAIVVAEGCTLVGESSTIQNNRNAYNGGGVYGSGATIELINCIVQNNSSSGDGGGIFMELGFIRLFGSTSISGNRAAYDGGGVFMQYSNDEVDYLVMHDSSEINYNTADGNGGGVYIRESVLQMHDSAEIAYNVAACDGGGVYANEYGMGQNGGSIHDNVATQGSGGGVLIYGPDGVFSSGLCYDNIAGSAGDDIYNDQGLTSLYESQPTRTLGSENSETLGTVMVQPIEDYANRPVTDVSIPFYGWFIDGHKDSWRDEEFQDLYSGMESSTLVSAENGNLGFLVGENRYTGAKATWYGYLLAYDANYDGGSYEYDVLAYLPDTDAVVSSNMFERAGYKFTGWNTQPDGSGIYYQADDTIQMDKSQVLYAQWEDNASQNNNGILTITKRVCGTGIPAEDTVFQFTVTKDGIAASGQYCVDGGEILPIPADGKISLKANETATLSELEIGEYIITETAPDHENYENTSFVVNGGDAVQGLSATVTVTEKSGSSSGGWGTDNGKLIQDADGYYVYTITADQIAADGSITVDCNLLAEEMLSSMQNNVNWSKSNFQIKFVNETGVAIQYKDYEFNTVNWIPVGELYIPSGSPTMLNTDDGADEKSAGYGWGEAWQEMYPMLIGKSITSTTLDATGFDGNKVRLSMAPLRCINPAIISYFQSNPGTGTLTGNTSTNNASYITLLQMNALPELIKDAFTFKNWQGDEIHLDADSDRTYSEFICAFYGVDSLDQLTNTQKYNVLGTGYKGSPAISNGGQANIWPYYANASGQYENWCIPYSSLNDGTLDYFKSWGFTGNRIAEGKKLISGGQVFSSEDAATYAYQSNYYLLESDPEILSMAYEYLYDRCIRLSFDTTNRQLSTGFDDVQTPTEDVCGLKGYVEKTDTATAHMLSAMNGGNEIGNDEYIALDNVSGFIEVPNAWSMFRYYDFGFQLLFQAKETPVQQTSASVSFTNNYKEPMEHNTGSLTVSKTVSGTAGESNKNFHFSVTLSDVSISGTYGDMTFVDGVATFTLKHGESKTATGLAAGISYEVTELEANQDGYATTAIGDTGTIAEGVTATAAFTNTRNGSPEPGPDPDPGPDIDITVKKVWKLDDGGTAADSVTVTLLRDGEEYATATLHAQNGWQHTWNNLNEDGSWTVEETEVPEGFTMTVNQQGYTFTIVNDDIPSEPEDPDEPDEPTTPTDPDEPDKPNPPKDDTPQTGDTTNLALWIGLLAISATGFTATLVLGKKKRYRGKHMR